MTAFNYDIPVTVYAETELWLTVICSPEPIPRGFLDMVSIEVAQAHIGRSRDNLRA